MGRAGRWRRIAAGFVALLMPSVLSGPSPALATWSPAAFSVWSTHGPSGGDVTALAIDLTDPAVIYVGTPTAGVFRSTDGAATWRRASKGLGDLYVDALALDPSSPGTVYAGTLAGVFKTVDGGRSWGPMSAGLSGSGLFVHVVVIDPAAPSVLYAGWRCGRCDRSPSPRTGR